MCNKDRKCFQTIFETECIYETERITQKDKHIFKYLAENFCESYDQMKTFPTDHNHTT